MHKKLTILILLVFALIMASGCGSEQKIEASSIEKFATSAKK